MRQSYWRNRMNLKMAYHREFMATAKILQNLAEICYNYLYKSIDAMESTLYE
jgi:hypothetical protein